MLLLPVPFELCMCPDKCFFRLKIWGEKNKRTGYIQLQMLICRQYYLFWLNQLYFSIFSLTEHWGLSVCLILNLQLTPRESLNPSQAGFPNQTNWLMRSSAWWLWVQHGVHSWEVEKLRDHAGVTLGSCSSSHHAVPGSWHTSSSQCLRYSLL